MRKRKKEILASALSLPLPAWAQRPGKRRPDRDQKAKAEDVLPPPLLPSLLLPLLLPCSGYGDLRKKKLLSEKVEKERSLYLRIYVKKI